MRDEIFFVWIMMGKNEEKEGGLWSCLRGERREKNKMRFFCYVMAYERRRRVICFLYGVRKRVKEKE